jgi:hypothetical protein
VLNPYTGTPEVGITIDFSDGGSGGSFSNPSAITNSNGVALTKYTLPTAAGTYKITATGTATTTVTFTETATAPADQQR